MRATIVTAIATCIAIFAAACDGPAEVEMPPADALCILQPTQITQSAHVMDAYASGDGCVPIAAAAIFDERVDVRDGLVLGAPLQLFGVTSYDGASIGARCVWDVRATARPTFEFGSGEACDVTFDLALRVVQP